MNFLINHVHFVYVNRLVQIVGGFPGKPGKKNRTADEQTQDDTETYSNISSHFLEVK